MDKRFVVAIAMVLAGCGGVNVTCQTQTCSGNAKTYQVCAGVGTSGGTEEEKFGGETCSCSASNTSGCEQCAQRVAVYCGNTTDAGIGNDMSEHSCTMTATGAVTGTVSCIATTVYASASNLGGPTLTIQGSTGLTLEATITRPGMVTSGMWSSSDSGAKGSIEANNGGTPTWLACQGCSAPQGTWSMNLTVESSSATSDGDVYIASGTITASLPAINGTGATGTVSFSASF